MRDQLAQRGLRDPALGVRAPRLLHLGAAGFDDAAVRNARRTDRLACPAAKAEVDVLHLLLVEGHLPALPLRHQVDAAARRFGLEPGGTERRAGVEAQPAVHAGREVVVTQQVEAQTTNLPGFNT